MRTARNAVLAILLEGLIDAEVGDLEPEGIDTDELVRHMIAQHKIHLGDVGLTRPLRAGARPSDFHREES